MAKIRIGFNSILINVRSEELDLPFGDRNRPIMISDDAQRIGDAENSSLLLPVDVNEYIGWKERALRLHPLPVLPDSLNFVGREKTLDLFDIENSANRVFALGGIV